MNNTLNSSNECGSTVLCAAEAAAANVSPGGDKMAAINGRNGV
jgi:hypothetical protein